jgi:nitric oxide reductase subunit B
MHTIPNKSEYSNIQGKFPQPLAASTGVIRLLLATTGCLVITCLCGILAALHYTGAFSWLRSNGLTFQTLRPLHTTFGVAWIMLAGMAMTYTYIVNERSKFFNDVSHHIARSAKGILALWIIAALAMITFHGMGRYTGREYISFPPAISVLVLTGWCVYLRSIWKAGMLNLGELPVYVWMWVVGAFLFIYTFIEAHAYLMPFLLNRPIRTLAIEWKSYGMLVGAMNLLVYGGMMYLAELLDAENKYSRSSLAFSLFFLGLTSSFTNFAHHTYHLPQSEWVKWISFVTSMAELVILFKVLRDLTKLGQAKGRNLAGPTVNLLLNSTTVWTATQLVFAILISIPPINSLLHGTLAILAHSMGSIVGIDTMAMLAVICYLSQKQAPKGFQFNHQSASFGVKLLNSGLCVMWLTLVMQGLNSGLALFLQGQLPEWKHFFSWLPLSFAGSGAAVATGIFLILGPTVRVLWAGLSSAKYTNQKQLTSRPKKQEMTSGSEELAT